MTKLRSCLFKCSQRHAEGLAESGDLKGDALGLLAKTVGRDDYIFGIAAVATKADFFKILAVTPVATATSLTVEAYHVVRADDALADPSFVAGRADCINDAAPLVTGNKRVVCGDVSVNYLKVGGADRRCYDLDRKSVV